MCIRDSAWAVAASGENAKTEGLPGAARLRTHLLVAFLERSCLLYTSDAADERSSVDLGGRRIIKKNNTAQKEQIHNVYET